MRARLLALPLVAVFAIAVVVTPAEGGSTMAAGTSQGAKATAKRVVVSPRARQVVRSHHVRLRVRSRGLSGVLWARLNGVQIADDFGRPRQGVRTLRASVSHGLQRGKNVLRVRVRRRGQPPATATVRFFVRTRRPLVGAGRHRRIVIGSRTRLYGQVKHIKRRGPRRAAHSKVRWKLVGPRRGAIHAAAAGGRRPLATLTSPAGLSAGFRPRVPGSYTLQLTHGAGRSATRDWVTIDAVPRSPLVPVDTMVSSDEGKQGIRVGGRTYLLRDAIKRGNGPDTYVQVLALERKTLAPVQDENQQDWNRMYTSVSVLGDDLRELHDTNLVILVLQPSTSGGRDIGDLTDAVGRIGVPDYGQPSPRAPGVVSAIGVPGMKRGDADVNVTSPGRLAPLRGYLTPDQYLNYGYVPSQRYAFSYGGKEVDPCQAGTPPPCDNVGYRLNVKDSHTFEARPGDNRVYNTGGRGLTVAQQTVEANRMAADLNAVETDDVVIIQTVGTLKPGETNYPPPVGAVSKATMKTLGAAVARVGGSREAFNRAARVAGPPSSGGAVYMLAGWAGARQGEGAEVAAGVEEAGNAPRLSFVLRPDRQSRFRPAQDTNSDKNTDALSGLMLQPPKSDWGLWKDCHKGGISSADAGVTAAIGYLGSTDNRLGSDPRPAYWTQPFGQETWDKIADGIKGQKYADVPPFDRDEFTEAQFLAAQCELETELGWVGRVRSYLADLSKPFADNALPSWAAAKNIANDVYDDVNKPDDEVAYRWIEFTEIVLDLLGPLTHEVSAAVSSAIELGVWAYGATGGGAPTYEEIQVKADELGEHFVENAQQSKAMFDRMGDVIVSDYSKLSVLGPVAGCNPSSNTCKKEFSLTTADLVAASADVYTSIRQMAYAELLPLGYHVFALTRHCNQTDCDSDGAAAPDPGKYNCHGYHPWYGYPRAASTALLQELDPGGIHHGWRTFVLSVPPGATTTHGTPPGDNLLSRAFGPISRSGDPKAGGAGLSLARLALETKLDYWYHNPDKEWSSCQWDG